MNAVIIDISAYTILILFGLYTIFGFAGLWARSPRVQKDIFRRQRFFLFAAHFNCYVALLADNPSTFIFVLYVMQLIFFFAVMKIYTFFYDDGSILLNNNMLIQMFTSDEIKCIKDTELENPINHYNGLSSGNKTDAEKDIEDFYDDDWEEAYRKMSSQE